MTIVEFLLARIAEDEALAEAAIDDHPHWLAMGHDLYQYEGGVASGYLAVDRRVPQGVEHIANWDPARVLAECQAKRAIIEHAEEATGLDISVDNDRAIGPRDLDADPYVGDLILRHLAAVYADHPDYREEWKP